MAPELGSRVPHPLLGDSELEGSRVASRPELLETWMVEGVEGVEGLLAMFEPLERGENHDFVGLLSGGKIPCDSRFWPPMEWFHAATAAM